MKYINGEALNPKTGPERRGCSTICAAYLPHLTKLCSNATSVSSTLVSRSHESGPGVGPGA